MRMGAMAKIWILLLLLAYSVTGQESQPAMTPNKAGEAPPRFYPSVSVPKANIRKAPNVKAASLGYAYLGEEVEVTSDVATNGFFPVLFDGASGWIHKSTIEMESEAEIVSTADSRNEYIEFRGRTWYWLATLGDGQASENVYFEGGGLRHLYFDTYEVWTLRVPRNIRVFRTKHRILNKRAEYLMQNLKVDCDQERLSGDTVLQFTTQGASLGSVPFSSYYGERVIPGSVGEDMVAKLCKRRS